MEQINFISIPEQITPEFLHLVLDMDNADYRKLALTWLIKQNIDAPSASFPLWDQNHNWNIGTKYFSENLNISINLINFLISETASERVICNGIRIFKQILADNFQKKIVFHHLVYLLSNLDLKTANFAECFQILSEFATSEMIEEVPFLISASEDTAATLDLALAILLDAQANGEVEKVNRHPELENALREMSTKDQSLNQKIFEILLQAADLKTLKALIYWAEKIDKLQPFWDNAFQRWNEFFVKMIHTDNLQDLEILSDCASVFTPDFGCIAFRKLLTQFDNQQLLMKYCDYFINESNGYPANEMEYLNTLMTNSNAADIMCKVSSLLPLHNYQAETICQYLTWLEIQSNHFHPRFNIIEISKLINSIIEISDILQYHGESFAVCQSIIGKLLSSRANEPDDCAYIILNSFCVSNKYWKTFFQYWPCKEAEFQQKFLDKLTSLPRPLGSLKNSRGEDIVGYFCQIFCIEEAKTAEQQFFEKLQNLFRI